MAVEAQAKLASIRRCKKRDAGNDGAMTPEPVPSTLEERLAFYQRFVRNPADRVPDPVEDAEREAHFETHENKGAKK
jgi:hypothetical protein